MTVFLGAAQFRHCLYCRYVVCYCLTGVCFYSMCKQQLQLDLPSNSTAGILEHFCYLTTEDVNALTNVRPAACLVSPMI